MEREKGFEPSTLCLGSLGSRPGSGVDLGQKGGDLGWCAREGRSAPADYASGLLSIRSAGE